MRSALLEIFEALSDARVDNPALPPRVFTAGGGNLCAIDDTLWPENHLTAQKSDFHQIAVGNSSLRAQTGRNCDLAFFWILTR